MLAFQDNRYKFRNAGYKAADIWHSRYDFLTSSMTLKVPWPIVVAETKLHPVNYMHRWLLVYMSNPVSIPRACGIVANDILRSPRQC